MLIIAVIGFVVNVVVAVILGGHDHHQHASEHHHNGEDEKCESTSIRKDLNLNSAFLHVIGDAVSSVGVILAAILLMTLLNLLLLQIRLK